jgi:hypothetical protein
VTSERAGGDGEIVAVPAGPLSSKRGQEGAVAIMMAVSIRGAVFVAVSGARPGDHRDDEDAAPERCRLGGIGRGLGPCDRVPRARHARAR